MRALEGRRLLGPNLLAPTPLVLVEVALDPGDDLAECVAAFAAQLARMRRALGFEAEVDLLVRPHRGGAVIAYRARRDELLAHVEASEWAAESASVVLTGKAPLPLSPRVEEARAMLERDRNDRLIALIEDAHRAQIPVLLDDESISLGYGVHSKTYARSALPAEIEEGLGAVPVALITGTNGKTTTTRLLAHLAREVGVVGNTSSDGVVVDGVVIERGDCTGPMAARMVLRDPRVEVAVLETARGGILRRGLAVDACDVAVITNVAADHLHDYGIDDVDAMLRAKAVVAQIARRGVVLNAGDPRLVALARELRAPVLWFGDRSVIPQDTRAVSADAEAIWIHEGAQVTRVMAIAELPIAFGGRARYNVHNALAAIAAALVLGIPRETFAPRLASFHAADNPGRGQLREHDGVRYLIDFAHNADGVRALAPVIEALRGTGTLTVIAGTPGDRSDDDLLAIADAIAALRPRHVLVRELHDYLRGRELGAVPAIYARGLAERGLGDAYTLVASEHDGLQRARTLAQPGDLVVLLTHVDPEGVEAFFRALQTPDLAGE